MVRRNKASVFKGIREGLIKRLDGWNERMLSRAGREVLIKAIALAIPTYTMSYFLLSKGWCDDLNTFVAKYWWCQQGLGRKIHWMKWRNMCKPKENGGLGFQDLYAFNKAL